MTDYTLTEKEETVKHDGGDVLHITNCASFTNIGYTRLKWSSAPISDSNLGAECGTGDGAIFSAPIDIYFLTEKHDMKIQARSETL